MTPLQYYQKERESGRIREDAQQLPVIEKLNDIYLQLEAREEKKKTILTPIRKAWKACLARVKDKAWKACLARTKGLYLWGGVGIGKTFLMDCFYHCLTVPKMRMHFHQFMLRIHQELQNVQGNKNPLALIAKKIAASTRVICFDEFFVSNIADAMILGELFLQLFQQGVTLVTSSNIPPDLLYQDGLQRERFLPAIALIKKNTEVVHLHSMMDYRQQHIRQSGVYYTPLDAHAESEMENAFIHFSNGMPLNCEPLIIYERSIPIVKEAGSVVWFDFEIICGRPRCQNDYLAITQQYHTVMIQNLREIKSNENDLILSFIYLVDILYDAHCRLIISSAVPLTKIYCSEKTQQPFQRTLSRLIEMQSETYVYPSLKSELTNL